MKGQPPATVTSRVSPADVDCGFSCGKHSLDDYFARHALANDRRRLGATYVLRRGLEDDPSWPAVIGYYTLSMSSTPSPVVAQVTQTKLPRYDAPVALVGRLAVDRRARGRGLGEVLLFDALSRVLEHADAIGCYGVVVDALDEEALGFYARYGFVALPPDHWPRRMFLPTTTIASLF